MVQILNTETMIHLTVYQEYSEGRFREKCLTHHTCSRDWKKFNIEDIYYPHDKGPIILFKLHALWLNTWKL